MILDCLLKSIFTYFCFDEKIKVYGIAFFALRILEVLLVIVILFNFLKSIITLFFIKNLQQIKKKIQTILNKNVNEAFKEKLLKSARENNIVKIIRHTKIFCKFLFFGLVFYFYNFLSQKCYDLYHEHYVKNFVSQKKQEDLKNDAVSKNNSNYDKNEKLIDFLDKFISIKKQIIINILDSNLKNENESDKKIFFNKLDEKIINRMFSPIALPLTEMKIIEKGIFKTREHKVYFLNKEHCEKLIFWQSSSGLNFVSLKYDYKITINATYENIISSWYQDECVQYISVFALNKKELEITESAFNSLSKANNIQIDSISMDYPRYVEKCSDIDFFRYHNEITNKAKLGFDIGFGNIKNIFYSGNRFLKQSDIYNYSRNIFYKIRSKGYLNEEEYNNLQHELSFSYFLIMQLESCYCDQLKFYADNGNSSSELFVLCVVCACTLLSFLFFKKTDYFEILLQNNLENKNNSIFSKPNIKKLSLEETIYYVILVMFFYSILFHHYVSFAFSILILFSQVVMLIDYIFCKIDCFLYRYFNGETLN